MEVRRLAITGFGNVGRRVAQLVEDRQEHFKSQYGIRIVITGVCDSRAGAIDASGLSSQQLDSQKDFTSGLTGAYFIEEVPADVLVESGPSNYRVGTPGLDYILGALKRGLHVVTVSKGALVVSGSELLHIAAERNLQLRMSGAAASALPTIDFLTYDLAGTRVQTLEAILTGTTTFVLDTMMTQSLNFEEALAATQDLGIAEPDPSFDIDGWDTAAKVVIIANAVFGIPLDINDLPRQSLRSVKPEQLADWRNKGLTPRLVGYIDASGNEVLASVALRLYPADHPFSLTKGSTKAMAVKTHDLGEFHLLGGASNPVATAAAALKDIDHILASGAL